MKSLLYCPLFRFSCASNGRLPYLTNSVLSYHLQNGSKTWRKQARFIKMKMKTQNLLRHAPCGFARRRHVLTPRVTPALSYRGPSRVSFFGFHLVSIACETQPKVARSRKTQTFKSETVSDHGRAACASYRFPVPSGFPGHPFRACRGVLAAPIPAQRSTRMTCCVHCALCRQHLV